MNLKLDKNNISRVFCLLVVAPQSNEPNSLNVKVIDSIEGDSPIITLILNIDEFWLITKLADTLPDFLDFLELRWLLHSTSIVSKNSQCIDEWMISKFDKEKVVDAIDKKSFLVTLGANKKYQDDLFLLEKEETISYLIDHLVEFLYQQIDLNILNRKPVKSDGKVVSELSPVDSYRMIIPFLARLKRSERLEVATAYCLRVDRCQHEFLELSYGGIIFDDYEEAYVVLSTRESLEQTKIIAHNLSRVFCNKYGVKKTIIIFGSCLLKTSLPSGVLIVDGAKSGEIPKGIEDHFFAEPEFKGMK